jgi:ATP-dependent helicase YprA (DUF1998 family)
MKKLYTNKIFQRIKQFDSRNMSIMKIFQRTKQFDSLRNMSIMKIKKIKNTQEEENEEIEIENELEKDMKDLEEDNIENNKIKNSIKLFTKLGIKEHLAKILVIDLKYDKPTKIQKQVIPIVNKKKHVIASDVTGSGKTAAYMIPILQKINNFDNSFRKIK